MQTNIQPEIHRCIRKDANAKLRWDLCGCIRKGTVAVEKMPLSLGCGIFLPVQPKRDRKAVKQILGPKKQPERYRKAVQKTPVSSQTRPREERTGNEEAGAVSAASPCVVCILPISEGGSSVSGVVRAKRPDEINLAPEPQDRQPTPPQPYYKHTGRQTRVTSVSLEGPSTKD